MIVPVYNAADTIAATLGALAAQRVEAPFEVVIVDGGSTDGTLQVLETHGAAFTLLHNPKREPATSRNLGARRATAKRLAFTDADCSPDPGWLAAGLAALDHAEIVQGRVVPAEWVGAFDRTLSVNSEYGLYETANLFVRRDVFDRVGGFEPIPGMRLPDGTHFGEDTWFVWRAKRIGARTAFANAAVVRHVVVRRRVRDALLELRRRRHFPPLVALIPELREAFLHRRWFLSPDSERFDLALIGMALALLLRRPTMLLLAAPYARRTAIGIRGLPRDQMPRILAGRIAADAVTLAALARGSAVARTLVL